MALRFVPAETTRAYMETLRVTLMIMAYRSLSTLIDTVY